MKRWQIKPLAEVAEVIRGVTFDKSQVRYTPNSDSIPILRAGNIQESLLTDSDLVYVPAKLVSDKQLMKEGDLAICMSSGSPTIVGKTARLENDWQGSVGAFCAIVRFNTKLHHRLGSYWFHSSAFLQWRNSNTQGANIQNLRRSELETLSIPVPPLAEQERIMTLLDEANELRKLRIEADHRTSNFLSALFHEMFGDPLKKTKRWPNLPLGEVVDFGSGATPSKDNSEFWNGNIPWVSPKDMKQQEIIESEDHVSAAALENTNLHLIPKNTVLIVVRGMILAHTVPIRLCRLPVTINQDMKALLPKQAIEPDFLLSSLQAQHGHLLNQVTAAAHGTKKLDSDRLREVTIPVPPLSLQKEFAQRVIEIRELEAGQAASRRRLEELFQSLLHRAFSGEL